MNTVLEQEVTVPKILFDSLKDSHEDLKRRYAMVEQALEEKARLFEAEKRAREADKKRIDWLEKAYLKEKNTNRWTENMINHPHIQQTRDRVLLNELVKRTLRVSPGEDGKYRAASSDLAAATNLTKDAVWDSVKALRGMGVEIETEDIPGKKGNHKRYVYSIPQELKDNPREAVKPAEKSNYGGVREAILCPNCGSTRNAHISKDHCIDCGNDWNEKSKANNRGAVAQVQEEMRQEDTVKPDNSFVEEDLPKHMETLFPEKVTTFESSQEPVENDVVTKEVTGVTNKPPRPHPICHPKADWTYDDLFEKWFCKECNHG